MQGNLAETLYTKIKYMQFAMSTISEFANQSYTMTYLIANAAQQYCLMNEYIGRLSFETLYENIKCMQYVISTIFWDCQLILYDDLLYG